MSKNNEATIEATAATDVASGAAKGFGNASAYGMIAQGVGGLASAFPTPNAELNANNQKAAQTRQAISGALMSSGNPYAMAAGAAVMVLDKTGGFSDVSEGLGKDDALNAMASFALPGAGYFLDKTDTYKMSGDMAAMSSSYAGSVKDAGVAESNSGAKLFFGRNKANAMIANAKARDAKISDIKQDADLDFLASKTMGQAKGMQNTYNLAGGYNQGNVRVGRFGLQIEKVKNLSHQIKFKVPEEVKTLKNGGELLKEVFTPTSAEQNKNFFANLLTQEEIQEYKKGGKIKIEMADGSGFIEVDSLDKDQKAGRKPIGHKNGKRLYLSGDGKKLYMLKILLMNKLSIYRRVMKL